MAPPVMVNALWVNLVDTDQRQSAGQWTLQDQSQLVTTPYDALITATQAMSCMGLFSAMEQRRKSIAASATTGVYGTYRDQAVFPVRSANAQINLVIPGPKAEIFSSDNNLVNMGNALVQDWWEAVQAVLGDERGAAWLSIGRGYRKEVRGPF